MELILNPDYSDMLLAFIAENVEFMVVGAYAIAVHAVPRATGDIDLWVKPSASNADRVWAALKRFGAPTTDVTPADFASPGITFQMGIAPRRIDILTTIDGVSFEEAWTDRVEVNMAGLNIPVIGKSALLTNKKAAGRPKDWADVAFLEGKD